MKQREEFSTDFNQLADRVRLFISNPTKQQHMAQDVLDLEMQAANLLRKAIDANILDRGARFVRAFEAPLSSSWPVRSSTAPMAYAWTMAVGVLAEEHPEAFRHDPMRHHWAKAKPAPASDIRWYIDGVEQPAGTLPPTTVEELAALGKHIRMERPVVSAHHDWDEDDFRRNVLRVADTSQQACRLLARLIQPDTSGWLTCTEAAMRLGRFIPKYGDELKKARNYISKKATQGVFTSIGNGPDRRVDPVSFGAWILTLIDRDIAADRREAIFQEASRELQSD